jgi:hypothetical protein
MDAEEARIIKIRKAIGTASPLYRPNRRFWNWLFDTEYTAIGPAPIVWAVLLALVVVWFGALAWFLA